MEKQPVGFFQALTAILWAFIGIRKGKASLADQGVKPLHFICAGVFALAMFVFLVNVVVRLVIRASAG